ncbi:MAG: PBP1A family penicillin-binding protein [Acidobacteriia bacterium]|nr:PBP1A family penicillin-binding protein [Terriglobia bacterium]
MFFALAGIAFGVLLGYEYNLPKIQSLEDFRPDVITDLYSDDNKVIGEFAIERRIVVTYEEIPAYLQLAILAAEDERFFSHSGIDYLATLRAVYKDIISMERAEGASTITQQLSRLLMGNTEKTFDRKVKELLIAWKIEKRYSKRQIFTLYCNQHYFGHGAFGVAAAADTYFGKQLKDVTLDECAMIAGLPRNVSIYSPLMHPNAALARRNYILDRMVAEKMISAGTAKEAKAKPLMLKPRTRNTDLAPYFVEWVRQSLADRYTTDAIWRKGLRVYTTLNIDMQTAANKALREGLRSLDKKRGWRGPITNVLKDPSVRLETYAHPDWRSLLRPGDQATGLVESVDDPQMTVRIGKYRATLGPKEIAWTKAKVPSQILKGGDLATFQVTALDDVHKTATVVLDQIPEAQGALITLDNATGEIKAMVGGYDFETSEFNRATQAWRQVGSTFKPFVYSTALEIGMDPESTIMDEPVSFTDALGRVWNPVNYDGKYKGQITLHEALIESRNVPTIKLASEIGIKTVLVMARRFGLTGQLEPYLPLAIGACQATPLEMATAFTVFPNLGIQPKPYFIRKIEDYDHVKKEQAEPRTHKVLEPDIAEQMLSLLQDVVQNGTAKAAKSMSRPLGGKTGTTNDFADAWFVGFSPSITTAVWVGFDSKRTLGDKEAGAVVALPIWMQFMQEILKGKPVEAFPTLEILTNLSAAGNQEINPIKPKKLFVEDLPGSTRARKK